MKKLLLYILTFSLGLYACQETVDIDPKFTEPKVVVEGLITNAELNYVRLTKSRGFYSSGKPEGITNADVVVDNSNGGSVRYLHNPNNVEGWDGVYLPETPYEGTIGTTYTLTATVDGEVYTAQETMLPVTSIDSLKVRLDEEEMEDPEDEGRFYEVLFYAQEPQDRVDYYLFKFYRNGAIMKDYAEEIYFAEDELVGEEIDDLPIAGFYAIDDVVKVEMYSITRQAFVYYSDLYNLLNNDGGMFSPPPANPRTNVSNGALGYFQVSAMDTEEIVVRQPED